MEKKLQSTIETISERVKFSGFRFSFTKIMMELFDRQM